MSDVRVLAFQDAGGDYLWSVKDNQPALREEIETAFQPQSGALGWGQVKNDSDIATEGPEKGQGRIEMRRLTRSSLLEGYSDWPGLAQVYMLETTSTNHYRTDHDDSALRGDQPASRCG